MSSWVKESVFYHIYPLGFCGAPKLNIEGESVNRIKKVIEWIPNLKALHINAVYLGPIFESTEHGYDIKDFFNIDKRLGCNEDFKEVCEKLHGNNIRVVLDGVFNHVGREFDKFKDLQKNREKSKYVNWFQGVNFNGNNSYNDGFNYEGWNGYISLVKLNLRNDEVVNYIFKAIKSWIQDYDIDGLRLDAANYMDLEFFRKLKTYCKKLKKDFWLMGEVIGGDYNRWANKDMLDSVTNYEVYKGIYSSHNDKNYFEIAHSIMRQNGNYGIYKNIYLYNFVDNHDVTRIFSILKEKKCIKNVYTILFTIPGVPSIYYGSEWGIEGVKGKTSDDELRPNLQFRDNNELDLNLYNHIQKLSKFRRESDALKYGEFKELIITNEQLVYKRMFNGEEVYVLLNLSDKEIELFFNINKSEVQDIFTNKIIKANNGGISVKIGPYSSYVFR